ncbi:type I methionyl aminopeptidase [Notoacmeibacter sp. MSK16QG-6]|uniref:type I methionyl aminopeptidase n=1 Tax=Notoacmeibacter sp. MSK16QG-6 TaxID=2957982 RepID=UPI00209F0A61|nr:type I methionyl aminopeptidase [Notoacmeibacter sp. MSK16QG-6]MCP1199373.1 type I methionyl aminopeptidase [Notoacmeibacter sp. MSK16QG-6]
MTIYIQAEDDVLRNTGQIRLYGPEAFEGMRRASELTARCLDELVELVKPGTPTEEIDDFVFSFGLDHGAVPATLNYRGYRKSSCTSKNEVVCHGIPDRKPLREGDIVNIDVTYVLDGWHGDSSRMYPVGRIKPFARKLLEVTQECLMKGIGAVRPGVKTGAIGEAIQTHAEANRYSVVRDFCGHGVGALFHDAPNILHYGRANEGIEMREGMIFTIEPMINMGRPHVRVLNDGWTAITADRKLTAQYEHTVGVTENGCEIFTRSPAGLDRPGLDDPS